MNFETLCLIGVGACVIGCALELRGAFREPEQNEPLDPARERKGLMTELSYLDADLWEYQRMAALGRLNRHETYRMLQIERRRPEIIARLRQLDAVRTVAAAPAVGRAATPPTAERALTSAPRHSAGGR